VDAVALGHAADDPEHDPRPILLMLADQPDAGPDLVLRLLADRAGVVEHDIGRLPVVGEAVAQAPELAGDQLAVEHIHLAAEGLEVDARPAPGMTRGARLTQGIWRVGFV